MPPVYTDIACLAGLCTAARYELQVSMPLGQAYLTALCGRPLSDTSASCEHPQNRSEPMARSPAESDINHHWRLDAAQYLPNKGA